MIKLLYTSSLFVGILLLFMQFMNIHACPGNITPVQLYHPLQHEYIFSPDSKIIELNSNTTFQLALPSNPTTGYSWTYYKELDQNSPIEFVACYFIRSHLKDDESSKRVGSGGTEYWELRTKGVGEINIELEYSRPWLRKPKYLKEKSADLIFHTIITED